MIEYNQLEPVALPAWEGPEAIVIGASAGAIEALSMLLPPLPANFPLPVLVVVHLPRDRASALPELFRAKCRVEVKEA